MKRLSLKTKKFQRKKPISAQSKLLTLIFERHGGIVSVAKKLKVSKQLVFIWRAKGYVPLSRVNEVAKLLDVDPLALNFKEYSKFLMEPVPWENVYKKSLSSLQLDY